MKNEKLEFLISRIENVSKNGEVYSGRCPLHEDDDNLFSFRVLSNGFIFASCQRRCSNESIMNALKAKSDGQTAENSSVTLHDTKLTSFPVLSEKSLYGLAGEIVRTIEPYTEADKAALLFQVLAGFGCLIGKTAYFRAEADFHYTKLFAVFIGASGKDLKGASFGYVKQLLYSVDRTFVNCLQKGLTDGEGIIYQVRDPEVKRVAIENMKDFVCYLDEVIYEGIDDKRALIYELEFAEVLRVARTGKNTLSSVMCQAWDSDCLQLMKKKPVTATDAHISIIGQLTKDELLENFNKVETPKGFADRFLWVVVRRSKLLLKNKELPDSDRDCLAEKLSKAVTFAHDVKELKCDYQAQIKWAEIYQTLATEQPGLLGLFTSKAELQVMRIACLYTLLDCSETIQIQHLEAALSLWQYCEDSVSYIFDNQTGNIIADSIYKALLGAKEGMTKTNIRDLFRRNQTAKRINEALSLLLEHGQIEVKKKETKGRYIKVYRVPQPSLNNRANRDINDS
jgi:hypothetical protein